MTSRQLKMIKKTKSKNFFKAGCIKEENIEINEHYLDKILKNNKT